MSSEPTGYQALAPNAATNALPPFADFGQRVAAFLIDIAVVTALGVVGSCACGFLLSSLLFAAGGSSSGSVDSLATPLLLLSCVIYLIPYLVVVAYHTIQLSRSGQTIGKRVMKIQVVSKSGAAPTFGQALGRTLAYNLSELIFFVGYLFPLWDEQRQALHDKVAGTYVVKRPA